MCNKLFVPLKQLTKLVYFLDYFRYTLALSFTSREQ